jgi:hypothetical protein
VPSSSSNGGDVTVLPSESTGLTDSEVMCLAAEHGGRVPIGAVLHSVMVVYLSINVG